ncbi:DNA alkylation repair protein [Chloroflexota bacterium]
MGKAELDLDDVRGIAAEIDAEICALPTKNTPSVRAVRCRYSHSLRDADRELILDLARELIEDYDHRWLAYELIACHRAAFRGLREAELVELGQGVNSWGSVDAFARILAGPAWLQWQVPDGLIHSWARSGDRWWRRAAVVSTVALNARSHGGQGDVLRTLVVCRLLVTDQDDLVVKAMSWALRELIPHDPEAVQGFLHEYEGILAARVKREVKNKLSTGLKNPGLKGV